MSSPMIDERNLEPPPRPSRGRTVISGLLVIGFLMVLTGMVLPLHSRGYGESRKTSCGNNQRQIILSSMVYANDNNDLWPCRPTDAHGHATSDPAAMDGFCTAAASMELLMVRNTDLPVKIFVCPSNTGTSEYLTSPVNNGITYSTGISQWGANHLPNSVGGPGAMPYAYDWSAPKDASAIRIMSVDRGTITVAHKKYAMGTAADGHVVTIPLTTSDDVPRAPGAHVTMDLSGGIEAAVGWAKDASISGNPDDVYDHLGDEGNPNLPGRGSTTRCWVR